MTEEVMKSIYKTIVEDGCNVYKDLYENTEVTNRTTDYWKSVLVLYHSLGDEQKTVFMEIIKQTIIDTISSIFGILDGSSSLSGENCEFKVKINGISTDDELQDAFLEIVERISIK